MLNDAYDSVSIEPKKPFTVDNVREVVDYYNNRCGDTVSVEEFERGSVKLVMPRDPFCLVSLIEMRLDKPGGYKLIDGNLIIPDILK